MAAPVDAVAVALASMETTSAAVTLLAGADVVDVEARAGSSGPHLASHPGRFERAICMAS